MPAAAYFKKPIAIHVVFATVAGTMQTLEGPVSYVRGDALVTGVAGERWPIPRDRFERTYRPAEEGGAMGLDGRYTKVPVVVQACQTAAARRVTLSGGRGILDAKAGDWIVTASDGETWVVNEEVFRKSYAPVEQPAI